MLFEADYMMYTQSSKRFYKEGLIYVQKEKLIYLLNHHTGKKKKTAAMAISREKKTLNIIST
jgi:hypothetical protein